jgi:hypothetical protein
LPENQQSVQGNDRFLSVVREKTGIFDQIVLFRSSFWRICIFFEHSEGKNAEIGIYQ